MVTTRAKSAVVADSSEPYITGKKAAARGDAAKSEVTGLGGRGSRPPCRGGKEGRYWVVPTVAGQTGSERP